MLGIARDLIPIVENQMGKKMEDNMNTGAMLKIVG